MKKRLLVVDDDKAILTMLAAVLRQAGYTIALANDGHAAWTALTIEIPDLILSDYMMPNLTGSDLCKLLRQVPRYEAIPVIIMSGSLETDLPDHCRYDAFLSKPFLTSELLALIDTTLARAGLGSKEAGVRVQGGRDQG